MSESKITEVMMGFNPPRYPEQVDSTHSEMQAMIVLSEERKVVARTLCIISVDKCYVDPRVVTSNINVEVKLPASFIDSISNKELSVSLTPNKNDLQYVEKTIKDVVIEYIKDYTFKFRDANVAIKCSFGRISFDDCTQLLPLENFECTTTLRKNVNYEEDITTMDQFRYIPSMKIMFGEVEKKLEFFQCAFLLEIKRPATQDKPLIVQGAFRTAGYKLPPSVSLLGATEYTTSILIPDTTIEIPLDRDMIERFVEESVDKKLKSIIKVYPGDIFHQMIMPFDQENIANAGIHELSLDIEDIYIYNNETNSESYFKFPNFKYSKTRKELGAKGNLLMIDLYEENATDEDKPYTSLLIEFEGQLRFYGNRAFNKKYESNDYLFYYVVSRAIKTIGGVENIIKFDRYSNYIGKGIQHIFLNSIHDYEKYLKECGNEIVLPNVIQIKDGSPRFITGVNIKVGEKTHNIGHIITTDEIDEAALRIAIRYSIGFTINHVDPSTKKDKVNEKHELRITGVVEQSNRIDNVSHSTITLEVDGEIVYAKALLLNAYVPGMTLYVFVESNVALETTLQNQLVSQLKDYFYYSDIITYRKDITVGTNLIFIPRGEDRYTYTGMITNELVAEMARNRALVQSFNVIYNRKMREFRVYQFNITINEEEITVGVKSVQEPELGKAPIKFIQKSFKEACGKKMFNPNRSTEVVSAADCMSEEKGAVEVSEISERVSKFTGFRLFDIILKGNDELIHGFIILSTAKFVAKVYLGKVAAKYDKESIMESLEKVLKQYCACNHNLISNDTMFITPELPIHKSLFVQDIKNVYNLAQILATYHTRIEGYTVYYNSETRKFIPVEFNICAGFSSSVVGVIAMESGTSKTCLKRIANEIKSVIDKTICEGTGMVKPTREEIEEVVSDCKKQKEASSDKVELLMVEALKDSEWGYTGLYKAKVIYKGVTYGIVYCIKDKELLFIPYANKVLPKDLATFAKRCEEAIL